MLGTLTSLLLCLAPPGDLPPPASDERAHTRAVHAELKHEVKVALIPHLRAYQSLSADVGEQLEFMDDVDEVLQDIDRFRQGIITRSMENSVPGFGWITSGYDELKALAGRVVRVRVHLSELERTAGNLTQAAERYAATPCDQTFAALTDGYADARSTFEHARESFGDLSNFLTKSAVVLEKTAVAFGAVSAVPLLGKYAQRLESRVLGLAGQARAAREILRMTCEAIRRDQATLSELQHTVDSAHAHDAYDEAERLVAAGRPGTALSRYRALQSRWPDTAWAHKADRKLVELTAYLDELYVETSALRQEVSKLRGALDEGPEVVIRPVERTRVVPLQGSSSTAAWLFAGLAGLIAVGMTFAWLRART